MTAKVEPMPSYVLPLALMGGVVFSIALTTRRQRFLGALVLLVIGAFTLAQALRTEARRHDALDEVASSQGQWKDLCSAIAREIDGEVTAGVSGAWQHGEWFQGETSAIQEWASLLAPYCVHDGADACRERLWDARAVAAKGGGDSQTVVGDDLASVADAFRTGGTCARP